MRSGDIDYSHSAQAQAAFRAQAARAMLPSTSNRKPRGFFRRLFNL